MKPGMKVGIQETVELTVSEAMFASFEGNVVHPTYSTVSMVYHMEWASRKIILPYLEEEEEGMGGAVTVKHIAPSPLGSKVTVTATLSEIRNNVIVTKTKAENEHGLIGAGEVKQIILKKEDILQKLTSTSAT